MRYTKRRGYQISTEWLNKAGAPSNVQKREIQIGACPLQQLRLIGRAAFLLEEVNHMTDEQRQKIEELRWQGLGYKAIAKKLELTRDDVRNYCRRRGLMGYGRCLAAMARDEHTP